MIQFQNVSASYPDGTVALKNISFSIKPGVKVAVLGESGSGKSTLFQLLAGLIKPVEGVISLNNERLHYKKKDLHYWRTQFGFVLQNPDMQLFAPSVEEDVMYGLLQQGQTPEEARVKAREALNACGVDHLRHKPPHTLSAGEKKRAAIAGAAAMNPDIFVMDEPEAGLDPVNTSRLTALIHNFHQQNKTVICATHNIDFAYEWADEWLILNEGKLLVYGGSKHFFEKDSLRSIIEYPWAYEIGRMTKTFPLTKKDALQQLRKTMTKK